MNVNFFEMPKGLALRCVLEDVTEMFGPVRYIFYFCRKFLKAILHEADRVSAFVFLLIHTTRM